MGGLKAIELHARLNVTTKTNWPKVCVLRLGLGKNPPSPQIHTAPRRFRGVFAGFGLDGQVAGIKVFFLQVPDPHKHIKEKKKNPCVLSFHLYPPLIHFFLLLSSLTLASLCAVSLSLRGPHTTAL